MSSVEVISSILNLLAGIGVFLVACTMMSSNLEAFSSKKLKKLFAKTSKNKLSVLVSVRLERLQFKAPVRQQ